MTGRNDGRRLIVSTVIVAMLLASHPVRVASDPTGPEHATTVAKQTFDRFGGVPVPIAAPTGSFTVRKVNDRWILLTPDGHPFWMLGVFNIDRTNSVDNLGDSYANRVGRKYGDTATWARQTLRRLRSWNFNTAAEYASLYVLAFKQSDDGDKIPFVTLMRPSHYGLKNQSGYAPAPFKDLRAGIDPAVVPARYRGAATPDVFDPNFDAYVDGWLRATIKDPIWREALTSSWVVGIATDDTDDLVGFGPGPELPTPVIHDHIGWIVLATNPAQAANGDLGVTYKDARVFSKYALRDFLRQKYGTVGSLNKAWGSRYTTFESDGGWPRGSGFLDESGRNTWVGSDPQKLSKATPGVVADLDLFLYEFAKQYFSVVTSRIRQHAPRRLVFGPATLNGWGGLTRRQILQAAGQYLDVLQTGIPNAQVLASTAAYSGDIPIVTWEGWPANGDSSLWRFPNSRNLLSATSQEERGRIYREKAAFLFNAATPTGVKAVVGLKFWAWCDSWGEKTNWGLVSFSDNAYDGKEATVAGGTDRWGYRTGGEERSYGDFLSAVAQANETIQRQLAEQMARTSRRGALR